VTRPLLPCYRLGPVSWADSQALYHAQAHLGRPALNILWPTEPYVCIGRFQDLALEVDEERCRERGLPIVRREVGGGAVYLDGGQVFYQIVLPDRATGHEYRALFSLGLGGVAEALKRLGVSAAVRGTNDVAVGGRKISGNGAGTVGRAAVVVGNILLDFDYEAMAAVLRVPDEKFRDKAYQSMRENLVSLVELRPEASHAQVADEMVRALADNLAPNYHVELQDSLPDDVVAALPSTAARLTDERWLRSVERRRESRRLRIREGVALFENRWKAPGGLLRAHGAIDQGVIQWLSLSGDFFVDPPDALEGLEAALTGTPVDAVRAATQRLLDQQGLTLPGVTAEDVEQVVLGRPPSPVAS